MSARWDEDDAVLINEFTVVNPKTQQIGTLQLWAQNSYGTNPLHLIVDGRIAVRGLLDWNDCTPKGWMDIDTSDGVDPAFRGQGWGTALYLGAALAAHDLGYEGIVSFPGNRKPDSDAVWARFTAAGLTKRIESEEGFRHDSLSAKAARATGFTF